MTDPRTQRPQLSIGTVAVRGHGLDAAIGRAVAEAVGLALAGTLSAHQARFDNLDVTLPASALGRDGRVDLAAVAAAIGHQRRAGDA